MNRYQSHKIVTAARIVGIEMPSFGAALGALTLLGHNTPVPMPRQWAVKHNPQIGGFLVQYEDGYSSFSPAKAFEEGYHLIEDGVRHTVWPLRTSCEPEALVQDRPVLAIEGKFSDEDLAALKALMKQEARRPLQLVTVPAPEVPGLRKIIDAPDSVPEHCEVVQLIVENDGGEYSPPRLHHVVSAQWFRDFKPQVGGGIVPSQMYRVDPTYYPPGSFTPALPKRVTKAALEAMFRSVTYEIRPDGRTTVCEITFKNGFTLREESSCAHIDSFVQSLGEQYAYQRALDVAWGYAGFLLMEDRYREGLK